MKEDKSPCSETYQVSCYYYKLFFDKERNGLLSCVIHTVHPVMHQL